MYRPARGRYFAVEVQIGLVWVYVGKLLRIQGFGDNCALAKSVSEREAVW